MAGSFELQASSFKFKGQALRYLLLLAACRLKLVAKLKQ